MKKLLIVTIICFGSFAQAKSTGDKVADAFDCASTWAHVARGVSHHKSQDYDYLAGITLSGPQLTQFVSYMSGCLNAKNDAIGATEPIGSTGVGRSVWDLADDFALIIL